MTPPSSSTARASGRTARPWLRSSARTRSGAAAGCRRTGPARATRARRRRRRRSSAAKGRPSAASTSSRTRSRSSTSALANSASRAARRCRSATSRARSRASSRPTGSSIGGVDDTPPIAWTPSPERIASATITRYREWLSETRGLALEDYADLWQWSVDELEDFWRSIWEFFEVDASEPYERVLTTREMPGAQWFPGARLSYAEHIFRRRADDEVAIRHASELRPLAEWTWGELRAGAGAVAGALREAGVVAGDRVAGYLPNIPETVAAFLGCASIGATWSSCAPEFGVRSVVDRFAPIEPKVLLTVDGYRYGGRDFDRSETIAALERELPTLRQTLVLPYLAGGHWELAPAELEFAQLPFHPPLRVPYSSGTTRLPKAIVHGQGGILLEHLKKLRLHLDAQAGDRLFWFTTTGWMMWNFLVGGLLSEASIVLFDGNPAYPDLGTLWDLADAAGLTSFGTSAGYIAACPKAAPEPRAGRDLSRLDSVGSTGSPLAPEGFDWVRDRLGGEVLVLFPPGGTDVCTAFFGGGPTLPVYPGQLQARVIRAKG